MDIREVIGKNIRRIRRAQNMSQEELAHRIDIANGTYISRLERGLGNPTAVQLEALARALNVLPGELFTVSTDIGTNQNPAG